MLILPGSNALSAFRAQRLLTQLQDIDPAITGISARYLHFIDAANALSRDDEARLGALLTPFLTLSVAALIASSAPDRRLRYSLPAAVMASVLPLRSNSFISRISSSFAI